MLSAGTSVGSSGQQRLAASIQKQQARQDGQVADYAQTWRSWGETGRTAYVLGFMEGQLNGIIDSSDYFGGKCDQQIVKQYQDTPWNFAGITVGVVGNVMTDLYGDPANSLIPFSQVLSIARDKITGKPIEELLIAARRAAVGK